MSGEKRDLEIVPPIPRRRGCQHIEWRNTAPSPDDMPEMQAYCLELKAFISTSRSRGVCERCILYVESKGVEK